MLAYDLALALRDAGVTVVSGFHSPMEKECLALLLRGTQPVVVCPARGIEGMRLPGEWRGPLAGGRLLILSPFTEKQRRVTADLAWRRNEFAAALADAVVIVHAEPQSRMEQFSRDLLAWGKRLLTLGAAENANLIALGAQPGQPATLPGWWETVQ